MLTMRKNTVEVAEATVPILRVTDAERSAAWYRRLGFTTRWLHRFSSELPAFAEITRGPVSIFLSEHTGDALPDTLIYLRLRDLETIAAEFGVEVTRTEWDTLEFELTDPDGNRLRVGMPTKPL